MLPGKLLLDLVHESLLFSGALRAMRTCAGCASVPLLADGAAGRRVLLTGAVLVAPGELLLDLLLDALLLPPPALPVVLGELAFIQYTNLHSSRREQCLALLRQLVVGVGGVVSGSDERVIHNRPHQFDGVASVVPSSTRRLFSRR